MSKVYIAARLFTPAEIAVNNRIAALVALMGMEPVLPQDMSAPIWKGRAPKDCTQEERRQVVALNMNGLLTSDIMIARVSGGTKEVDTGVAWEMGYMMALTALMQRRLIIAYIEPSDPAQSLNLMLAETVHAAAYGDAQLHQCLSGLIATRDDIDALSNWRSDWSPDKIILHEREPIGFSNPHDEAAAMHGEVDHV